MMGPPLCGLLPSWAGTCVHVALAGQWFGHNIFLVLLIRLAFAIVITDRICGVTHYDQAPDARNIAVASGAHFDPVSFYSALSKRHACKTASFVIERKRIICQNLLQLHK